MIDELFIVKTEGGVNNFSRIEKWLHSLAVGKYILKADKANKRTSPQNRYYFGLVVPMMQKGFEDLGHELSKQETHEFLKSKFNSVTLVNHDTGETINVPKSTTKLSKSDFGEYIEKIQRFAAEFLNIVIPEAGERETC